MAPLNRLADPQALEQAFAANGLGSASQAKSRLMQQSADHLQSLGVGPQNQALAFFVPGRIEVLGKHTDYAGGSSIVAAVERGFCMVAVPRNDNHLRLTAADGETVEFALDPELVARHGHWSNYPMTVARRLSRNFPACRRGLDIAFASDLPPAAGMSSSSALIVATYLALAAANGLEEESAYRDHISNDLELAAYLGTIENGQNFGQLHGDKGVGTFGGSEDHTAILCSQAGALGQFAYCPARFQRRIDLDPDLVFVVGFSGTVAEKTGAAQDLYNAAALRVAAIVQNWQQASGEEQVYLADILQHDPEAQRLRPVLAAATGGPFDAGELTQRLEHFIAENQQILPAAGDALAAGDLDSFGRWVDRSQHLSQTLLGNQIPATTGLARTAREQGALAASAFGAGFGGSVWALIHQPDADAFIGRWRQAYTALYPTPARQADFWLTGAGPAAQRIDPDA
jgi:galactokinase